MTKKCREIYPGSIFCGIEKEAEYQALPYFLWLNGEEHRIPQRGATLGIGSIHADAIHWFPRFGKNIYKFLTDVKTGIIKQKDKMHNTPESWATEAIDWENIYSYSYK